MQVLASTAAQRIIGPVHGVRDWSRQRGIIPDIRITHSLSFVPSRTPLRNVRTCQACWTGDEEKEGMGLHKRLLLGRKRNCKVQYVPTHDILKNPVIKGPISTVPFGKLAVVVCFILSAAVWPC